MTDNQREAGTIILDPTHVSFSQQEGVNDLGATHFIGIGGAGMSVLAEMLHEQGVEVDGSDREPSAKTDRLQGLGIAVEFGQREENAAVHERDDRRQVLPLGERPEKRLHEDVPEFRRFVPKSL